MAQFVTFPWSSAKVHVLKIKDNILSANGWLEEKEIKASREFLKGEDKEAENNIRKATSTARPLGRERFIKKLGKILERDILLKKAGRLKKRRQK